MKKAALPQPRSLAEQVAEYLSDAILHRKYAPGQPIIEQEVADAFGLSRGPVREAFRILEKEGVVVINPRRSVHVTQLTLEEVAELFQIREVLFGLAARLCAERREKVDIAQVRSAYEQIRKFIPSEKEAEQYSDCSAETTRVIVSQCGNERLMVMLNRLGRQVQRYSLLGLSTVERQKQSMDSFSRLVEAICEGRADDAEFAAKEMVFNTGSFAAKMLKAEIGNSKS